MKKTTETKKDYSLLVLAMLLTVMGIIFADQIAKRIQHDCRNCTIRFLPQEPYR